MLFTNELQKRLEDTGIYCLTIHPGSVLTELQRGLRHFLARTRIIIQSGMMKSWPIMRVLTPFTLVASLILATPEQGALIQLYAATSPEIEEKDLK